MIEDLRRVIETVRAERLGDSRSGLGDLGRHPAIDSLLGGGRIEAGDRLAFVHLAEARRVPQLGGEVAEALDPAFRQLDVAALGGESRQCETQRVAAEFVDQVEGVDDVALRLRHLLPLLVADQGVDVDVLEGDLTGEMHAHHHHAGDPEEDDVEAGDQHRGRIELLQSIGFPRPAQGREGPQRRGEPGVEHVGIAAQFDLFAIMDVGLSLGLFLGHRDEELAVGGEPRGDLVSPPDLARDAPGLDVAHPFEIGVFPTLGHEAHAAVLHRLDGRLGQGLGIDEPLVGQPGLDNHAGAVAVRLGHGVGLDLLEQPHLLEGGDDLGARLEAVHALIFGRHRLVQLGVAVEDVDHRQIVALADLEIVEIMRRRDLDRARSLLRVGIEIGDDRNQAVGDGQTHLLADQIDITLILGMHGDAGIAQHGLRAGGRDDDEAAFLALDRIFQIPEIAVDRTLLDLEVGDRGMQLGVPIDQALVAINQALLVEIDEHLADRVRQAVIHGETLARPVRRGAQAAQLAGDGAARFAFPGPDALDELLATEIMTGQAFRGHLALDHHLRRDTGMIGAGLPQRVEALHAVIAGEDVLQGEGQRVAHMQAAGYVRRRHHDGIGLPIAVLPARGEGAALFPFLILLGLDVARPIGLIQH